MTTIHTSRPELYRTIADVTATKLSNKTLEGKSSAKIDFFLGRFYGIGNLAAANKSLDQGSFRGLYAGREEVRTALDDVQGMREGKARTLLMTQLTSAKNTIDRQIAKLEPDLHSVALRAMMGSPTRCQTMPEAFAVNALYGQLGVRNVSTEGSASTLDGIQVPVEFQHLFRQADPGKA